jgi:hypothetical protein
VKSRDNEQVGFCSAVTAAALAVKIRDKKDAHDTTSTAW